MKIYMLKAEHIAPLTVFGNNSRSRWRLTSNLKMMHGVVPKGFISDGVTIPYYLFFLAKPTGTMLEPAVWHDFALSKLTELESRRTADEQFKAEGLRYGVNVLRVNVLFYTVRIFGVFKVGWCKMKARFTRR